MKHIKLLTGSLALLAGLASTASCATNGVVLGQDFQSVIDASSPGDTLIVQPGVYTNASLVFNKPLTVLPSGTAGDPIQFMGNIQVTGAGASSLQRAYFGGSVQTTGATVSFFDSYFNGNVNVTGGKVTMKRTLLNSPLTLSGNAALEALRMTNNAAVNATATVGSSIQFLAVQSWFTNRVYLTGYKVWLGYNNFTTMSQLFQTNCDSVLVGNKFGNFTPNYAILNSIIYSEGGSFKAYNNLIASIWPDGGGTFVGIWLKSNNIAEIVNNTILLIPNTQGVVPTVRGVYASDSVGSITVRGDILDISSSNGGGQHNDAAVEATGTAGQRLFLSYCNFFNNSVGYSPTNLYGIMVPPVNCLNQVNPNLASDYSLNAGSPCINAGPPDAIYNNRDGTRNTMGYTGGPYWNPANYTNNNPMVFLLIGQQTAIKSIQTSIPVSVGASAGH